MGGHAGWSDAQFPTLGSDGLEGLGIVETGQLKSPGGSATVGEACLFQGHYMAVEVGLEPFEDLRKGVEKIEKPVDHVSKIEIGKGNKV